MNKIFCLTFYPYPANFSYIFILKLQMVKFSGSKLIQVNDVINRPDKV